MSKNTSFSPFGECMRVLEPIKDALSGHSIQALIGPPVLPLEASILAEISQMRCFLAYT
jgi:hypothetical protein